MLPIISAVKAYDQAKRGELIIIDVRRTDEWKSTGIPEFAHGISMNDPQFIEKLQATGATQSTAIALICAAGVRSHHVQQQLISAGFTDVYNIFEGMMGNINETGWLNAKLPVVVQ